MDSRRQEKDFPQTKPDAWLKMATTLNAVATAMEAESAAYSEANTYFKEAAAVMRASITPDVSVAPLCSQNILQEPNRVYSFVQPAPVELEKDSSPKPNPAGDARLNATTFVNATLEAAVIYMEAVADARSEAVISVKKAAASIRAAFTPDVSVAPLGYRQNIALVPNTIYSFVQPPVELEKDSPQPNNPDDAMLKATTALKAAVAAMEALGKSEAVISWTKTNASIRAAFSPVVSADPALISQNIVNEPHAVSSLEPPVELESVRDTLHSTVISEKL